MRHSWATLLVLLLPASLAAQAPGTETSAGLGESWAPLVAEPRIGGRLTAVALSPSDPTHVVAGTEEGDVLVSHDGGMSFALVEVSTRIVAARSVALSTPDAPRAFDRPLAGDVSLRYRAPFSARPLARPSLLFDTLFFSLRPEWASIRTYSATPSFVPTLLRDAVASREDELDPIVAVAICPGAAHETLVATRSTLFGGDADEAFLPLFHEPGVAIGGLACARGRIAVATSAGAFVSEPGGDSLLPVDFSPTSVSAVAFDADAHLVFGVSRELMVERAAGELTSLHPESPSGAASWGQVRSIASAPGLLAVGTDDGLHLSRDGGLSWQAMARDLFDEREVIRVAIAPREGREPLLLALVRDQAAACCARFHVFVSEDGGASWLDRFPPLTRRSLHDVALAASAEGTLRAVVVSSGELWSSPPQPTLSAADPAMQRWASRRLARSVTIGQATTCMLAATRLEPAQVDALLALSDARLFMPTIEARVTGESTLDVGTSSRAPTSPWLRDGATQGAGITVLVQVVWRLRETDSPIRAGQLDASRTAIAEIRERMVFLVEDAFVERATLLTRLARGVADPLAAEIARERVRALEALLHSAGACLGRPPRSRDA